MTTFKNICFVGLLLIQVYCPAQTEKLDAHNETNDVSEVWQQFLNGISENDTTKFKALSGVTIKCYNCLENTDEERITMNQLRMNDSTWYERIYNDMIYIPIADFIDEDFDFIFTTDFVKILNTKKPIFIENSNISFVVLVTTIESSEQFEGMQHSFQFKKVDSEWKFTEISTIP